MTMTSDAKNKLSKTIRSLRDRLLTELNEATDREYRLSIRRPKLDTARMTKRRRLEDWLDEQVRGQTGKHKRTSDDFRRDAEKQAAYTLLNRLLILRIMEATELRKPAVVTGGWNSRGYKDFRELAPALVRSDDSEGYSFLLQLIFEDLATDLPGLYGSAGIADLIPVPSATIRAVVEAFDDPELESCWTDDMTLGWVYQYWNDPEREALDAKINDGGKIEPHEIASKTQMFTERYMVDWLLQKSNPVVRHLALTALLDRPADDGDVAATKQAIWKYRPARRLLAALEGVGDFPTGTAFSGKLLKPRSIRQYSFTPALA